MSDMENNLKETLKNMQNQQQNNNNQDKNKFIAVASVVMGVGALWTTKGSGQANQATNVSQSESNSSATNTQNTNSNNTAASAYTNTSRQHRLSGLGTRIMITDFGLGNMDRQRIQEIEPSEFVCSKQNGDRTLKIAINYNSAAPVSAKLYSNLGQTQVATVSIGSSSQVADFTNFTPVDGIDRVRIDLNASGSTTQYKIVQIKYFYNTGTDVSSVVTESIKFDRLSGKLIAHETIGVVSNSRRRVAADHMNGRWEVRELATGDHSFVKVADWDSSANNFNKSKIDGVETNVTGTINYMVNAS